MSGGLAPTRLARMDKAMAGFVERGEIPGIVTLVARGSDLHINAVGSMSIGGRPMARDTIFRIASMTKPVTAAAAMILVEECRLRLDEPVDRWLPELAGRRVLRRVDGPLEDTVPANRAITLRDLITLRMGLGYIMESGEFPVMKAAAERGIMVGPPRPAGMPGPDEWIRRVGELPLTYQPGERWQYDLGMDVLGILIGRAAGRPFEDFLKERVFDPLGMNDTGFYVPEEEIDRLATSYMDGVFDESKGGGWSRPPAFASGGGGLVSTADDYNAFARMLLRGGEGLLARPTVEAMTTDQLLPAQKVGADIFFGEDRSWGLGMCVFTKRAGPSSSPGRFGWDGGLGTSAYADSKEGLIGILLTQQAMTSPTAPPVNEDFWTLTYASITNRVSTS